MGYGSATTDGTNIRMNGRNTQDNAHPCRIYDGVNAILASNITLNLVDEPTVFIERRPAPICDVPPFSSSINK